MAITPNNYSFTGGAFMGGDDTPVARDDIHSLNITKNGESLGNYNPLVGDAIIDIPSDAFVCYYDSTTAAQIHAARRSGKAPYLYIDGIIVPLWKIETGKFTFRTTSTREVDGDTYLDIVDYAVEGLAWSTETHTVSGNSGSQQQAYLKKVSSLAVFDTTGHSGMETVAYVNDVPVDGVYQVSVMLSVTPKTASPTKSDLVFQFTGTSGTGMPNTTFHAVVDDSQTFAQQLSFSTTLNLKAGTNSLKISCGGLNTEYLVFVDDLTVAQIVNGSSSGGGSGIYGSLQDAIADAASLNVGDIFETNGFHTSGDGGAARYHVSDTGTANGMDIVQLAAGKLAVLQVGDWIIPEQLGYDHAGDVVPYISHAISNMAVQHIHLSTKGTYHWKSSLDVNMINGFELTGEGDWGHPRKFSYINVDPSTNISYMMKLAGRSISVKNIDIEVTGTQKLLIDGIVCDSYADGAEFYFNFDNIRMNSFKECWRLEGGIKWHIMFNECQPANSTVGIHIRESSSMLVNMREVFFNHCSDIGLWFEGNIFTAKIDSCNFGSMNTAIKCSVNSASYLYQNLKIDSCNFEDDNVNVGNRPAVFIDCYDSNHLDIRQNITISNCNFTLAKASAPIQDTTNRYIRLGKNTNIVLINNQIFGMNEPEHPSWVVYPKLMWNTSIIPTEGSVCELGMNLFFDYPDELTPYVTRNGRAIGFRCYNAENPTDQALADCNGFLPLHNGEMRAGRVSSFENTANLPTTGIFGYLMVFGVIDNPNKRAIQILFASNNNVYTRIARDTGSGWTYLAWKTITAT